jgi:hypothetical protein
MPLTIRDLNGLSCPTVVCDHCHQPIERAKDGNYQWRMDLPSPQPMYFTHKRCCLAFEDSRGRRAPGVLWGSMELSVLSVYLERNLALKHDDAVRLADCMASI